MTRTYKFTYVFAAIAAVIISIFFSLASGGAINAFAATAATTNFEQSNVLDDLEGAVIDGVPFSRDNFGFDETKSTQLLVLVEFGYNFYSNMQQDYGLYVYVYNPQGIDYVTNSKLNKISLRYGSKSAVPFIKYNLQFINQSTDKGAEGLFYKFKIVLSDEQRVEILENIISDERVYEVAEVELYVNETFNAVSYPVAKKYRYSGYAENYGPLTMTESTLILRVDNVKEHLKLDVKHTVFRPQGDYYNGQQSQLNSCYFRVPEKYFSEYGELINIGCEWNEYVTQPILVTETDYLYKQLYNLHGASIDNFPSNMYFLIGQIGNTDWVGPNKTAGLLGLISNKNNFDGSYTKEFTDSFPNFLTKVHWNFGSYTRYNNFAAVFKAEDYSKRYVSSDDLKTQLLINSKSLGGSKINDKYSESLFSDTVNEWHTRGYNKKEIGKDDLMDVFWNTTIKSSTWQKWTGGYDVDTIYDSVKAIEEITDDKINGTDSEISQNLFISKNDVADLKNEVRLAKQKSERVVLFRYSSSEYYSMRCVEAYCSKNNSDPEKTLIDACMRTIRYDSYTAYTFQETVFLDFDIIYLSYIMNNVKTVIPVISSPQDVVSEGRPPLEQNYHYGTGSGCAGMKTFSIVLIAIVSAVAAILIVKLVIWIWGNVNQSKKD